jgi:hypothetical protein
MSLKRILNDHPAPSPVPSVPPPPNNLISPRHERSPSPTFPQRSQTPNSRQAQSSPTFERRAGDFSSRSGAHQDTSTWEPDPREWRQPSRAQNGNTELHREVSPSSVQEYQYGKNEEPNAVHKKRKRAADDDGDYRPPTTRRVSQHAFSHLMYQPLISSLSTLHADNHPEEDMSVSRHLRTLQNLRPRERQCYASPPRVNCGWLHPI